MAVGSQSRALAEAAREGGVDNVVWVASREEAAGVLKSSLQPNDWVLFKASRGMGLDQLVAGLGAES